MPDPGNIPEHVPGWLYALVGGLVSALATMGGALAKLYIDWRSDTKEHAATLERHVNAARPSAETIAKMTTTQAVTDQRLETVEERVDTLEARYRDEHTPLPPTGDTRRRRP